MPAWRISSLAKTLLPSSSAASRRGPKIRRPSRWKASTIPRVSGSSGPTTVRPTPSRLANWIRPRVSFGSIETFWASSAVPALPGAQKTAWTRGDCFNFQQRACSRPPLPITRTFNAPTPETVLFQYTINVILSAGAATGQAQSRVRHRGWQVSRPDRRMRVPSGEVAPRVRVGSEMGRGLDPVPDDLADEMHTPSGVGGGEAVKSVAVVGASGAV